MQCNAMYAMYYIDYYVYRVNVIYKCYNSSSLTSSELRKEL